MSVESSEDQNHVEKKSIKAHDGSEESSEDEYYLRRVLEIMTEV